MSPPKLQARLTFGEQVAVDSARAMPGDWLDVLPASAHCLRAYQRDTLVETAQAMHEGYRRILVQGATGSGKTHCMSAMAAAAVESDLRVLILATRSRLVRQIHERLAAFGIAHGVIAATLPELRNNTSMVQVASADTLYRRAICDENMPLPAAEVLIFDESHLSIARTRLALLDRYPEGVRIGFTATPASKSGRSLGMAFDVLIPGPSIRELTRAGVLVPVRIFNTPLVSTAELKALPKDNDNDFQTQALGSLVGRPKLIGDVVSNWLRIAAGRRTLCFAVDKAHGVALLGEFNRQGIAAEMLTDADDENTREEVMVRLQTGATRVIINCFLLAYGVDIPEVDCIILARPTRSLTMYLQMVGRGLRSSPGKTHCVLIDHGHVVETLGLPNSDFNWTLDPNRNVSAEARDHQKQRKRSSESARTCGECSAMWLVSEDGRSCPDCGWTPAPNPREVRVEEADLAEMADEVAALSPHDIRVIEFFRQACAWGARRNQNVWAQKPSKIRWAAWMRTIERFGLPKAMKMPSGFWSIETLTPSAEVAGWLMHRWIKWTRGQKRRLAARATL